MRIAITGASGFVGQHLAPYLAEENHTIYPINLRAPHAWKGMEQAECIIHLAGKAHDHAGTATEQEYMEVNLALTQKAFQAFRDSDTTYFIHFSSVAAVSDEGIEGVLYEDAEPRPQSLYGKSKLAAETFLAGQLLPPAKRVFILRPAMIHGPGDKGNLSLLYNIVKKGIPYPLGAFDNQRSFLSIDNLCFAIEQLLQNAATTATGIYNLVDDEPLSTKTVIEIISQTLGRKPRIWRIPPKFIAALARIGDYTPFPLNTKRLQKMTQDYRVSNDKIKQAIGLDRLPVAAAAGLRKTIEHFRSE